MFCLNPGEETRGFPKMLDCYFKTHTQLLSTICFLNILFLAHCIKAVLQTVYWSFLLILYNIIVTLGQIRCPSWSRFCTKHEGPGDVCNTNSEMTYLVLSLSIIFFLYFSLCFVCHVICMLLLTNGKPATVGPPHSSPVLFTFTLLSCWRGTPLH